MNTITPEEASRALAQQSTIRAHVAAGAARYATFLVGLAAASSFYVLAIGMFPLDDVPSMVTLTIGLGAWVAVLCIGLLPGARVSAHGFSTRFGLAMGGWGAAFGIAIGIGLAYELPQPWFWVFAPLVAVPLLIGAWLELRGPRG